MTKSDFTALAQALALVRHEVEAMSNCDVPNQYARAAGKLVWSHCVAAIARACVSRVPTFNQSKFLDACNRREERTNAN